MLAHRLRHSVAFEMPVYSEADNMGTVAVSWTTAVIDGNSYDNVPAEVLTGPGREALVAAAKQEETAARINVFWFPGLNPSWRIKWDGRIYNIIGLSADRTGCREWRIQCAEGLNDGQ